MTLNVLSLFDGMSCGQIALDELGIDCNYFASEIDTYCIKVTKHNYPNTIHLGDVTNLHSFDTIPSIDLLLGGSPCQALSYGCNSYSMDKGFEDPRSNLFFEFVRIKNEVKPRWFLFENVRMRKEHEETITKNLGVKPITINSNLVSAQNRIRLYWTNIPFTMPKDEGLTFKHIQERNVYKGYYCSEEKIQSLINLCKRKKRTFNFITGDSKLPCITATQARGIGSGRLFGIRDKKGLRNLVPLECERAQNVPDNYTSIVSNAQRYKMLGNGWTINIICAIIKNI